MSKNDYSEDERGQAAAIVAALAGDDPTGGILQLRRFKDGLYAAIPEKKRQSRGITWVLERVGDLLAQACDSDRQIYELGRVVHENLDPCDRLQGVAAFLMAAYGKKHPEDVFPFFIEIASSEDSIVREFAQGAFRKLIYSNREVVLPWLKELTASDDPNLRRFVSETLRPVTDNRWLQDEPETSLEILSRLFAESHPYPRTSVGNNLSDLSRRNPEVVFSVVAALVARGDKNSYWIAYRACRNLVKGDPERVLDVLGVNEYHYKDRYFVRKEYKR